MSKTETAFGAALTLAGLGHFRPQAKIGRWTIDFLFEAERIAVEFDGDYWHSLERVKAVDGRKNAALAEAGLCVFRVKESLFKSDPASAVAGVASALRRAA